MMDTTMTVTFDPSPEFREILDELCAPKEEYVVESPITIEATTEFGETTRYPTAIRERIVRCRDCAHFLEGDCLLLRVSMPDMDGGFCAWGERGER